MAWMDHPVPVGEMPGMASPGQIAGLAGASGAEADALFIRLMTAHHDGGIHMAEHAWRHGADADVRELAESIAKLQRLEIRDLQQARIALDLPE